MTAEQFLKQEGPERERLHTILSIPRPARKPGHTTRRWDDDQSEARRQLELLDLWKSIYRRGEDPAQLVPAYRWPQIANEIDAPY